MWARRRAALTVALLGGALAARAGGGRPALEGLRAASKETSAAREAGKKKSPQRAPARAGSKGHVSSSDGAARKPASASGGEQDPAGPPPPDPTDEQKDYALYPVGATVPGSFDGDVRDLPQIPSTEKPEFDLLEPADYVHRDLPTGRRAAAHAAAPLAPAPAPRMNFAGLSFLDTCTGGQCGTGHPPDTNGDVGLTHYVQGINESYAIYDKATGRRLAAFTENSLWDGQGVGTPCNSNGFGDPIVMYDQTADRWILTNLAFGFSGGTPSVPVAPFYQCLAVSKSGDPVSGGWWFYSLRIDQGAVPANTLNDYPKFGNWNDDCLYMGANGFASSGLGSYTGQIVASFDKSDMYNGLPVRWALGFLSGSANFSLFPANMLGKGDNLPASSTPEYFAQESTTTSAFNVRKFNVAGTCMAGGMLGAATVVPHAAYSSFSGNIVPQPSPATGVNLLDSLGNRLMQRVQYRKVGAMESLWVVHTARPLSFGAPLAPQWGQINVTAGTVGTPIVQQQIHAPDSMLWRWMGSLAVDNAGDMALGYSTSAITAGNFPSIKYAGRLAGDPLGTMGMSETTIVAGAGAGVFNCGVDVSGNPLVCHRWGDYSGMSVDPTDDCTFWYTNTYYDSADNGSGTHAGNHQTRIASFTFPSCVPIVPDLSITKSHGGDLHQGQSGAGYTITVTNEGPGFTFGTVSVTDTLPAGLTATSIGGTGWTCLLGTLTCTSTQTVAAGTSYPPITLMVDVAADAPSSLTNRVTVSGSGDDTPGNDTAADATHVKANQTISFPSLKGRTYGDPDFGLGATASSGLAVSFAASGQCTVKGTLLHIAAAGSCTVTASQAGGEDFLPADDVMQTFAIDPRPASVTPNAAGKTYGDADPSLSGTLSGFLATDGVTAVYARTVGETVTGSPYAISATLGPASVLGNYAITATTAPFTISLRPAWVTPNPAGKTYGDADPALSGTLSGFLASDGVTAVYARAPGETVAGSPYAVSATLGPASVLGNYAIAANTAPFTISPRPASVTPNPAGKTYGDADPALSGTLSGFLATDGVTAVYARTAGETVAGSPYAISATLGPPSVLGNYAIAANTASFTISLRPASVTPNAAGKTYGDADPPLTGTLSGFLARDGVTAVYARTPGETVAGGPYTVFATLGPASVLGNYAIAYGLASFTIVPRPASVTPNPASKAYGDPDPPLTGTLVGFLAPDGVTAAYTRTPGETVSGSPYTIMATLLPAAAVGNYAVTYDTAPFTILGVRGLKGSLRADLKALRASVTDKKDGKELDDAMAELTEALLPRLWIDELHPTPKDGAHVFQEEKDAALELRELVKSRKSAIPDTLLLAFVDRIVRADRLLATVAIGDARGGDARKLDKASDEVQKGDRERLQGDAEGAIEHYRSAWWLALEAAS